MLYLKYKVPEIDTTDDKNVDILFFGVVESIVSYSINFLLLILFSDLFMF